MATPGERELQLVELLRSDDQMELEVAMDLAMEMGLDQQLITLLQDARRYRMTRAEIAMAAIVLYGDIEVGTEEDGEDLLRHIRLGLIK